MLCLALGCDTSGGERREARRFLEVYTKLVDAEGSEVRRSQLQALRELPLSQEATGKARDLCVRAHAALLDAEAEQEAAAKLFDQALSGAGGAPLSPEKIAPVQAGIDRSERALKEARVHSGECEDAARSLALRFAER